MTKSMSDERLAEIHAHAQAEVSRMRHSRMSQDEHGWLTAAIDRRDLLAEVRRLRAGADPTPVEAGVQPSPDQAWHALLTMGEVGRFNKLASLMVRADIGNRCFEQDHETRLAELDHLRHLLGSHADGHRCTCTMTDPGVYYGSNMHPPEWEQDPWCPTHPDIDYVLAEVRHLRESLAFLTEPYLDQEGGYQHCAVVLTDGVHLAVLLEDLRAALAQPIEADQ